MPNFVQRDIVQTLGVLQLIFACSHIPWVCFGFLATGAPSFRARLVTGGAVPSGQCLASLAKMAIRLISLFRPNTHKTLSKQQSSSESRQANTGFAADQRQSVRLQYCRRYQIRFLLRQTPGTAKGQIRMLPWSWRCDHELKNSRSENRHRRVLAAFRSVAPAYRLAVTLRAHSFLLKLNIKLL